MKSSVQDLFFEKQVKRQLLLGNFRNIKSKQRKQRVRKGTTENFLAVLFCALCMVCFSFKKIQSPVN